MHRKPTGITAIILCTIMLLVGCTPSQTQPTQQPILDHTESSTPTSTPVPDTSTLEGYAQSQGVTVPSFFNLTEGSINTTDAYSFVYQWLNTYESNRLSIANISEEFKRNLDEDLLKLQKADMIPFLDEYMPEHLNLYDAYYLLVNLQCYLNGVVYQCYSDTTTGRDLKALYAIIYPYYSLQMTDLVTPDAFYQRFGITADAPLTRHTLAEFFVYLFEAQRQSPISLTDYHPDFRLEDADEIMQKAHSRYLFDTGQSYNIYPNKVMTHYELQDTFIELMKQTRIYEDTQGSEEDQAQRFTASLKAIYASNGDKIPQQKTQRSVNNVDKDNVYVTQLDGSPDALINCAPACAAMLGRWHSDLDADGASARNDFDFCHGTEWSNWHVVKWLEQKNIPVEKINPNEDALIKALDEGAIVHISTDNNGFCHSMVVIGYEQFGDDITFLVYDPGMDMQDNGYVGHERYIPSAELMPQILAYGDTMNVVKR